MLVGAFTYSTATYQRANFWGIVQTQPNYRVLLGGPTVLAEQTLSPPPAKGKNGSPFGFQAAQVDINWASSPPSLRSLPTKPVRELFVPPKQSRLGRASGRLKS